MWPADAPPGDGSTTALALAIVQRSPAEVREPVELPEDVADPFDEVDEVVGEAVVLGGGVGMGGELLHAARAAGRPAAAGVEHTDRGERSPCVVTRPR
jgi:hypothetical protein